MSSTPLHAVHRHAPAPRPPAEQIDTATSPGTDPREPVTVLVWGSDEILRALGRSRGEVARG